MNAKIREHAMQKVPFQLVLGDREMEAHEVNVRGTKSVPGRKSDVQECQWLLKLHTYGLLRSCFLPAPEIHAVRTVWRLRDQHVKDAGRCILRKEIHSSLPKARAQP